MKKSFNLSDCCEKLLFLSLCHNWTHTRFSQVTVKNLKSRHITMAFENWMNERNGKFVSMLNFSPPQLSMHKSGCYCCFTQRTCADMLTHVRQIWNIIVMLLSSIFTDTENRKRPLLIRWCSLRSLSLIFIAGVSAWKMEEKKTHFMNPIMDFLTLVSFYCISLFMIPHSDLIPNAMTITAGPHCRRQRTPSIKTFFAMKRSVL